MIRRGDVYYADLSGVVGSEQGGVRPVVVVQNDKGNKYSTTLIVASDTRDIFGVTAELCIDDLVGTAADD